MTPRPLLPAEAPALALAGALTGSRGMLAGILLLVGAAACFACMDAVAKWINQANDPMLTACVRYISSFVLVSAVCNPWTPAALPRTRSLTLQCGRALCLVAATITSFYAYRHLPLTQATSITFASPMLVALLAGPLLGDWPGRHRLGAVAAGFAGVLVVTRPWSGGFQPAAALAFLTAVVNALYSVATRVLATRDRPLTTLFYTGAVGCAVLLPVLPFTGPFPASALVWAAMLALGALGALGHWLLILAHQHAAPTVLAPFYYAQLLAAAGLGWLMFGEVPGRWTISGGLIITASGLYLLYWERRRPG